MVKWSRGGVRLLIWRLSNLKQCNPEFLIQHHLKMKKVNPEPKNPLKWSLWPFKSQTFFPLASLTGQNHEGECLNLQIFVQYDELKRYVLM
jgi:hypothetical protein